MNMVKANLHGQLSDRLHFKSTFTMANIKIYNSNLSNFCAILHRFRDIITFGILNVKISVKVKECNTRNDAIRREI